MNRMMDAVDDVCLLLERAQAGNRVLISVAIHGTCNPCIGCLRKEDKQPRNDE